jgi:multimeric flavodoxin WrbA
MGEADLLIFASPVYVLRATGQMKTLLDHFAFQFMIHRPNEKMFGKTALIVTTAAGGGMSGTIKEMKASLNMWGVGRVFSYGKAVYAASWDGVSDKNKAKIHKSVDRIAGRIIPAVGRGRTRLTARLLFHAFRQMHKRMTLSEVDHVHWESRGWLGKGRPW